MKSTTMSGNKQKDLTSLQHLQYPPCLNYLNPIKLSCIIGHPPLPYNHVTHHPKLIIRMPNDP